MNINKSKNTEYVIYLFLVILTVVSYFLTEKENIQEDLAHLVIPIAGIKFFCIFYEFMDMKSANKAWSVIMVIFLTLILTPIYFLL
jgi:heme/copper-type cytochrome/quinol oxidase subunit 4